MNQEELLEKKEQEEFIDDCLKVAKFKEQLGKSNYTYSNDAQIFIVNTINKYRREIIVGNFYNSPTGCDEIANQYDTLCIIEKMLDQYATIKGFEINNNLFN